MSELYFMPFRPAYDSAGLSVPGSQHYFTEPGTNTPVVVYSDAALTVPLTNPVVADAVGKVPTVYLDDAATYRVRIYDRTAEAGVDTPLEEYDPYIPGQMAKGDPGANVMAIGLFADASGLTIPAGTDLVQTSGYDTPGKGHGRFAEDAAVDAAYVIANPHTSFISANGRGFRLAEPVVTPFHFGAAGDGTTDDLAALQAFNDWLFASSRDAVGDVSGDFAISGNLVIGPSSSAGSELVTGKHHVRGHIALTQLTAEFETLRLRNLTQEHWFGSVSVKGIGDETFASRTCGVGVVLENCGNMRISGGIVTENFWYAGVLPAIVNNDGAQLGNVVGLNCGSGRSDAGTSLQAAYSAPSNTGSAGSVNQLTTLTVDTFPDAAIETWQAVGSQNIQVRINGYVYYVKSWNRGAGTISIFPWIDSTAPTSGTLDWIFGGAFEPQTADGNCIVVDKLKAQNCGRGLVVDSAFGPRVNQSNISGCGVGIVIGKNCNPSCLGSSLDGFYPEGNDMDLAIYTQGGAFHHYLLSTFDLNLTKVYGLSAARNADNSLGEFQGLGNYTSGPCLTLSYHGRLLVWEKPSFDALQAGTTKFRDQRGPHKIYVQRRDSQTVTIEVQGTGEFNRLFGYSGATWRYIGTGANGAPTGTITFNPPSGGTVNGGAVDAGASFSGFSGPAEFTIEHTDKAQLTWIVRPVAGWRLKGSKTFDPPSIAASGTTTTTVTVAGAAMGDAFVPSFSVDLNGLVVTAYVSAADTVTVVFFNPTAGAIDKASGTLTVTRVG